MTNSESKFNPYVYPIKDFDNYDGDSFDLTLDLGFSLVNHVKTRINGIDTPELRGRTAESKAAAKLAKNVAREFVQKAVENGSAVFLSENYAGKFGRPLGDVINTATNESLVDTLIAKRLAVPYAGQSKDAVAEQHATNLRFLKETNQL